MSKGTHTRRISRNHSNLHFTFSPAHEPVIHIEQDEIIQVETIDCFNGTVSPANPSFHPPYEMLNPVTGPIYIKGANVGDVLAVTIHDIQPEGIGISRFGCCSGQLSHLVHVQKDGHDTRFFDFDPASNTVTMREPTRTCNKNSNTQQRYAPISFPASPMLGVVGVAPAGDISTSIPTMPAGVHGGNLDDRMNGIGSTIYFIVNQPGALLSIGDMHASMGDGEICGTGIEIGGVARISCRVIQGEVAQMKLSEEHEKLFGLEQSQSAPFRFPVTETNDYFYTHGVTVENIPLATTVACEEAARILVGQWNFTPEDAFVFLSVKGNLGLCQACHPDKGTQIARMQVPKINACPYPLRCLVQNEQEDESRSVKKRLEPTKPNE